MFGLRKLRFVDIGTGLSMMIASAGILAANALHAADPGCAHPGAPGVCNDKIYEDAAAKLKNLNPGCCTPAGPACAAPAGDGCVPAAANCDPSTVFCEPGCGGGLLGGELGEPWLLIDAFKDDCGNNRLKDNGWILGGFTQFGYQNKPDGAFTGNGPYLNQREHGNLNLNQQYLYFGKVADGSKGVDWGFRSDLMYGVDGNEGQSFGNVNPGHFDYLNGWGGAGDPNSMGPYEWALPQLYAEVAAGNLSVKLGRFYTLMGYEVVPSNGNFFLSRQLTFWNSEPFTHTGVMTSYKVNDKLIIHNCWVAGMDTGFYQYAGGSAYHGGVTYTIDDKSSFIWTTLIGDMGWRGDGAINSFIYSHKWAEKFSTVHQFDVLNSNLTVGGGVPRAGTIPADFNTAAGGFIPQNSIGFINYAFYDLTTKVKAGARFEIYSPDGEEYYTATYGVNYKPIANLVIRPEVRHMFSPNHNSYSGAGGSNFNIFNQTVVGIDAILTY